MKKIYALAALFAAFSLVACGGEQKKAEDKAEETKAECCEQNCEECTEACCEECTEACCEECTEACCEEETVVEEVAVEAAEATEAADNL